MPVRSSPLSMHQQKIMEGGAQINEDQDDFMETYLAINELKVKEA